MSWCCVSRRLVAVPGVLTTVSTPTDAQEGSTARVDSLKHARFHLQRLKDVGTVTVNRAQQRGRTQRLQIVAAGRELGMRVVPEAGMKFMHNMTMIADGHTGIECSLPLKHACDDVLQPWSQTSVGYTPPAVSPLEDSPERSSGKRQATCGSTSA
ncbi:MAG: hypothetical protein VYE68_10360 [Acidobacteriota bacterium]|nr:hypothetical protein [Acidobacteriota bacterium]